MNRRLLLVMTAAAACGNTTPTVDAPTTPLEPTANPARDIIKTDLRFDVAQLTGHATIVFAASSQPGATLEIGDLTISSVKLDGTDLAYATAQATPLSANLDLALPAGDQRTVEISFTYRNHGGFEGATAAGYTFLWPYYCGNLFPCHSQPRDGMAMTIELAGVPSDRVAVYPTEITEAPAYQFAWSIDAYTELPLGMTTAGTQVSVWYRPNELATAQTGTANLVAAFDWLEKTIGPYRFGSKVGTVSVKWGPGAYGGMEHHPMWHVSASSLGSEVTNVHEAAHGWFGDGVRIECWEDFVLSEGTVSYLAARALEIVAPSAGAAAWTEYEASLAAIDGSSPVWPQSCNAIDILGDNLYTHAPYMRGAMFYRGVALEVGAEQLDQVIAAFYAEHAGKAGRMIDMLAKIHAMTGYDPTMCAEAWLKSTTIPTPGACP
ncbi:MAG: M1 family metallopeptidase [Kofleriaceae bacterium]